MLRLHLLGFTRDLKGLVFSGKRGGKTGTYWVEVDETFARAVKQLERARKKGKAGQPSDGQPDEPLVFKGAKRVPKQEPEPAVTDTQDLPLPREKPKSISRLSPREIQQLLREGKSVDDVAKRAGVDEAWVDRFLGPVLEERAGVIRRTQEAYQRRARLGASGVPIGVAVRRNLEARRANERTLQQLDDSWEARRMGSGIWRVKLRFSHRGRRLVADWELGKDSAEIRPRNKLASELGWRPPSEEAGPPPRGAPRPRPEPVPDAPEEAEDGDVAPRTEGSTPKRASRKRAAPRRTTAKRTAARRTAKRPATRRRGR